MTKVKILQVTDCHLTPPGEVIFGSDPALRLRACIADINLHHPDATLCVFTGDLAHHADARAYHLLRECLHELVVPFRLMVGNHDDRNALRLAFPETPLDENGFVQSVMDTPVGRLLFLDTVDAGLHTGAYCRCRRNWLKVRLLECEDRPAYLFMHHPPFTIELPRIDQYAMRCDDRRALGALATGFPNIKHVFTGHVHRPVAGSWNGISMHALKGTNHQTWLAFDDDRVNICSLEPPTYGIAVLTPETTIVHFHDFLDGNLRYAYDPQAGEGAQIRRL